MTSAIIDRERLSAGRSGPIAVAGIAIGICYVLSPLTVVCLLAMCGLVRWASLGLDEGERRWVLAILIAAAIARVLVVLALYLATDHHQVPFGNLFGDEDYFIRRSLWMRNLALGLPMHRADLIYAYDHDIRTSFLYVLAMLQVLFGPAPYGAHMFSIVCYLSASIVLYRLVRPSYGRLPALLGLATLLFLPTQFAWSLSALKEPLYFLAMSVGLSAAVSAGRRGSVPKRAAAVGLVVVSALVAQSIRDGGLAMAGAGAFLGLTAGMVERRPRLLIPLAIATLVALVAFTSSGRAKDRALVAFRHAVATHWEQVNTPGYVFTIFDGSFYARPEAIGEMTIPQGVRYVAGALVSYALVPLPWRIQSRAALSYLPEQIVWYVLLALVPVGIVGGYRRDPQLTLLLAAYAATAVMLVALTSGNVGTLVRHRGLALPYLLWFSALGAYELLVWLAASRQDIHANHR